MRATVRNYINALKQRREEHGEEGFSLIELIVVVVILGILAAIAIPIFLNIQAQAKDNSVKTIAANGASQAAASLAQNGDPSATGFFKNLNTADVTVTYAVTDATKPIDTFCVTATPTSGTAQKSGPGC